MLSNSTFVSVFTIKGSKGASPSKARGVLMVNILNKCILSIIVNNYSIFRQTIHRAQYSLTRVYWLSS